MTERPEGAPDEVPTEPDAAAPEASAAATAEREVEPGAFEPEIEDAEIDDVEADLEAEEDALEDQGEDEFEDEPVVPLGVEPAGPSVAATGAAGPRRRGVLAPVARRAPTQSELAVRVTDNASRFLVIGTVVVFVGILVFGLVGGNGGLLTTTQAPIVVTAPPSVSAEPSASPSAGASASPAASESAAPSESTAPSASPS